MLNIFRQASTGISLLFSLTFLFSCKNDDSIHTKILPVGQPTTYHVTGFKQESSLNIVIPDTVIFQSDPKDSILPDDYFLDMPYPGDQGMQGSCSAWATVYAAGSQYMHKKTGNPYVDSTNLSPRFTYNQITLGNCGGTSILDNLYLLKTMGSDDLGVLPYAPDDCLIQPTDLQKSLALPSRIPGWKKIYNYNILSVKYAITEGYPVIFGIPVDQKFMNIEKPYIWKNLTGPIVGNHAMVVAGYDNVQKAFWVMNSWGDQWGYKGFVWIDYELFKNWAFTEAYIIAGDSI